MTYLQTLSVAKVIQDERCNGTARVKPKNWERNLLSVPLVHHACYMHCFSVVRGQLLTARPSGKNSRLPAGASGRCGE